MVHKPEISEPGSWNGFPSASAQKNSGYSRAPLVSSHIQELRFPPKSPIAGDRQGRSEICKAANPRIPSPTLPGGARRHRDFTAAGRDSFPSILTYPEGEDGDGGGDLMGKVGKVTRTPPEAKGGSAICTRTLTHTHRRNNSCFQNSTARRGPKQEDAAGLRSWPVWKKPLPPY